MGAALGGGRRGGVALHLARDRNRPGRRRPGGARGVRRLLLVSHRPVEGAGGAVARWRSFAARLPELGWEVDVISAGEAPAEYAHAAAFERRARKIGRARAVAEPALAAVG